MSGAILIIGSGAIALRHASNSRRLRPDCECWLLSASGRELNLVDYQADGVSRCFSQWQALPLAQIEAAIIAAPASHHIDYALRLASLKIPLLIEKPLALNAADAERLLPSAKQGYIALAYPLRFRQQLAQLKQWLQAPEHGRLLHVHAHVGQHLAAWRPHLPYQQSVSAQRKLGGGVLLELSHELDYLQWLLGPLTAQCALSMPQPLLQADVEQSVTSLLTSADGVPVSLHQNFVQQVVQRESVFTTENAVLRWNLLTQTLICRYADGRTLQANAEHSDMYLRLLEQFYADQAQAQVQPSAPLATVAESMTLLKTLDALRSMMRND
ncbi:Gfo/Idh/MocA family protein [Idiomarina xiamenensis]|uniref:Oxidoreductase domain-containing protein n=1 Tax=Idiomarina xiamenensis 10-D-4 TaxID=740709 RepID=K2KDR0_9GAMM|nr:Gfo/Idh/MocA family oxidoreductase [Idiomarina xiamenensis]EKE80839.1 oxidoreductase domain-containing protein [Idiomarina xiamenensis 10-D-4]